MSNDKRDDELSETARFLKLASQKDAEEASQLKAAREEATKAGKEPFSAEALSRYFIPSHRVGDEQSKVVKALEEYEWSYYLGYPQIMTLEEFGRKQTELSSYAT